MANNIQLTINVTDANASQAVEQIVTQLNALGPAGAAAGAAAGAGLDKVGESALSNKEQVRLLSEEIGVHVPRAMQSVIAQSELMNAAIGAIAPTMIAIGGVDILMHMADAAEKLWHNVLDVNGAVKDYNAELDVAKQKDFGNTHSIETTILRINEAKRAVEAYQAEAAKHEAASMAGSTGPWSALGPVGFAANWIHESWWAHDATASQVESEKQLEELQRRRLDQIHEENRQRIELEHVGDDALSSEAKRTAELQKQLEVIQEQSRYQNQMEGSHGNPTPQRALSGTAIGDGGLQSFLAGVPAPSLAEQLANAKYETQIKQEAIAQEKEKHDAIVALRHSEYEEAGKELALWVKQQDDADKATKSAQQTFATELTQVGSRSGDRQLEGYARIADQGAQEIAKVEDAWHKLEAVVGDTSVAGVDAQLQAADLILQINKNMEAERQHLHARTMEEIDKEEEQAARLSLAPWQQQEMAIVDAYNDRFNKIQENVRFQVMTEQEGARAVAAAWSLAGVQMQRSEEETRDKLAQGLQSLFSNPAQFFEKRAMDTAFQLMANEMLSTFKSSGATGGVLQYLFGMGPQMNTSTNPLDAMGSALGRGSTMNPSTMQFQQSTMTFSAAVSQFAATAGMRGAMGAAGGGSFTGLGGGSFGGGSISSGGLGSGGDFSEYDSGSNPMMLPGISGSSSSLVSAGTFDNSMMMPGLNGVAMDSALSNTGGAASMGSKGSGAAAGMAGGALMAGTSIYSAYQNSDPLSGLLGGAMGGMEAGAALGSIVPGIGTAVGAIGGALIGGIGGLMAGIFGDKGRGQAQNLDTGTIQPALSKDMEDYEAGRAGYNTVAPQLHSLLISAQNQTFQMGSGARSYFNDRIQPEVLAVLSSLQKQEIGGRSKVTLSAAQYHDGGWIGDFGDLASSENEGFIHAAQNEFVVNPMAAAAHAPILQAMNSGTNFAYSNSVQPRMPAGSSGGSVQLTIQALDSKSVAQWAKAGGGLALMAALNQAQRQYSGVGRG